MKKLLTKIYYDSYYRYQHILRCFINSSFQEAKKITENIDADDIPFIAFHLQYKHKIWSLDKKLINGLTQKGYGHFFTSTAELRKHLYKKV